MKTLHFNTSIQAPAQKVWSALWNDSSYQQWTSVFSPGSLAKSDWQEGSRILFLDGKGNGMYSVIDKKVRNKQMNFKHLGEWKDGKEQPIDEKAKQWSGARENYTLTEKDGHTDVQVEVEVSESDEAMMKEKFPPALKKLKELAEK